MANPNIVITSLQIEKGTFFGGDPLEISFTIWNEPTGDPADDPADDVLWGVRIHEIRLTEDGSYETEDERSHFIQARSDIGLALGRGESETLEWVRMAPGNLTGDFWIVGQFEILDENGNPTGDTFTYDNNNERVNLQTPPLRLEPTNFPETNIVSVGPAGQAGDGISEHPSLSANGRFVAFISKATNLDPERTGGGEGDIYLKDQMTGNVRLVTAPLSIDPPVDDEDEEPVSVGADGPSGRPQISPDGRFVAFASSATNLTGTSPAPEYSEIYVFNRENGFLSRVFDEIPGQPLANGPSFNPSISEGGRYIVFESQASNLVGDDTNNLTDIFLLDRETHEIRRINRNDQGLQAAGGNSLHPRISADGRYVVYESRATNLVPGVTNTSYDVYVYDRIADTTRRLSVDYDADGNPIESDGNSRAPALSRDGRFVTFTSNATNLFAEPATGSIEFFGRPARGEIEFTENKPAEGILRFNEDIPATGSVIFAANPEPDQEDRKTLSISDGTQTVVFEFDAEFPYQPDPDNVPVRVQEELSGTMSNLRSRIANSSLTMTASVSELEDGRWILELENSVQGEDANQPIVASPGLEEDVEIEGMSGAETVSPADGDELLIDNGFFETVFRFTTSEPTEFNEVQIGRTAQETRDNLLNTINAGLHLDLPDLSNPTANGTFLVGPFASNPVDEDTLVIQRNGVSQAFVFVERDIQYDPLEVDGLEAPVPGMVPVTIGESLSETRGNLLRYVADLFAFQDLPGYTDRPATGEIRLLSNPEEEDEASISVDDGNESVRFSFFEEFEEDEDDPDFDFEDVIIDDRDPNDVRIIVGENVAQTQARLLQALQGSPLEMLIRAQEDEEGDAFIFLVHNQVGESGNIAITFEPVPEEPDDPDEPAEDPFVAVSGMEGGVIELPEAGQSEQFYDRDPLFLHPALSFQYREPGSLTSGVFAIEINATGGATLGNLIASVAEFGLPRFRAEAVEGDPTSIVLRNFLPRGNREIVLDSENTAEPDVIQFIYDPEVDAGRQNTPRDGARITLDDGFNPPVTFEFDQNEDVEPGNIRIPIAGDAAHLRDRLIGAINQAEDLDIVAFDTTSDSAFPTVFLMNLWGGAIGNVPIEFSGFPSSPATVSISGMDGGQINPAVGEALSISDGQNPPVEFEFVAADFDLEEFDDFVAETGRLPVLLGELVVEDEETEEEIVEEDLVATRDNLMAMINRVAGGEFEPDMTLGVIASPAPDSPFGIMLVHKIPGEIGNDGTVQALLDFASFTAEGLDGGGSLEFPRDHVYVVDRDTNESGTFDELGAVSLELASITEFGTAGDNYALDPAISLDGRYVAFRTQSGNLQPAITERSDGRQFLTREVSALGAPTSFSSVVIRDREAEENRLISVNRFGEHPLFVLGGGPVPSSRAPAFGESGRFIAFASDAHSLPGLAHGATNRIALDNNSLRDVFVHDLRVGPGFGGDDPRFPPVVNMIEPLGGSRFALGVPIDLRASAFPGSGNFGTSIERVEFTVNGNIVGVDESGPYSFQWTPSSEGMYTISARAVDSLGNSATATGVQITVGAFDPVNQDEDFIRDLYQMMLNRAPDSSELSQNSDRLASGQVTREGLVSELMDRAEFDHVVVNAFAAFHVILGRAPTTGEMQDAMDIIRMFDEEDPDVPEQIVVDDAARFLGTESLALQLLTSPEFVNRNGPYQAGRNKEFIELLYRNIGRSPSDLDLIRANSLIGGTEDEDGVGRLSYTTLFIFSGFYFNTASPEQTSVRIGIPDSVRERYRRAALYFTLTGVIPDENKAAELNSGGRTNAVGTIFGSADYLNRFPNFFGHLEEVDGTHEKNSSWLGRFNDRYFDHVRSHGWINHEEHGWWYRHSSDSSWVYDHIKGGWVWTNEGIYPFFYSHNDSTWLFYDIGGTPDQRWFYFYNIESWQSVER